MNVTQMQKKTNNSNIVTLSDQCSQLICKQKNTVLYFVSDKPVTPTTVGNIILLKPGY
jgi:hypothetical protein